MSFPRTYRALEEMMRNMVKHTSLARAIVRKSGVHLSAVTGALESSLQWLIDLWFARRAYNQPTATTFGSDGGNGPYSLLKSIPKKRSSVDYDVIYQNDTTNVAYASQATYDIFEAYPTFWGLGGEYGVGANLDPYPGSTDVPAYTDDPDHFNDTFEDHPFITGSTTYDPYPYPEYPNYFWADLRHMTHMYHFHSRRVGGMWLEGLAIEGDSRPNSKLNSSSGFVFFELHASLDGGETWEGPYDNQSRADFYPYYQGDTGNVNPWAPSTSKPYYYLEKGEVNMRAFGTSALTENFNSYSSNILFGTNYGMIKNRFRVNNVLMKFVLRGALSSSKIYIGHYGVRAVCYMPPTDVRTIQGSP